MLFICKCDVPVAYLTGKMPVPHSRCASFLSSNIVHKTHYVFMGLLDAMIGLCTGTGNGNAVRSFLETKKVGYGRTKKNLFEALIINNKFISKNKPILKSFFQSTEKQAR